MTRRLRTSLAFLVAATLSAGSVSAAPERDAPSSDASADSDPTVARAREHFNRAQALYDGGHADAAFLELERAYTVKPSYRLLDNLGELAFAAHNYVASQRYFQQYMRESSAETDGAKRATAANMLITLRALVGQLEIHVNVAGATILVDDESAGSSPLADAPPVSAGRHKVTATKEGYLPQTVSATVLGGEQTAAALVLTPVVTTLPGASTVPEKSSSRWSPISFVGLGTAGALAGAATYFAVASSNATSKLATIEYAGSEPSREYTDQQSKASQMRTFALVFGGASAAVLATTVVWTFTRSPSEPKGNPRVTGANLSVVPGGFVIKGTFE